MNFGLHLGLTNYMPNVLYTLWFIIIGVSLFKPEWGLAFIVPLFPFRNLIDRLQTFPYGKDLVNLLLLAILLGWVAKTLFKREKFIEYTPLNWPVIIMVLLTYVNLWRGSAYLGIDMPVDISDDRVQNFKNYAEMYLLYFMVVNNVKEKKLMIFMVVMMALSVLVMDRWFISTYGWIKHDHYTDEQRMGLSYLGPNQLAAFICRNMYIFLAFLYIDNSKLRKILSAVLVAASLYTVIFAFSRSAYLGILVGLLAFGLIRDRKLLIPLAALLLFWKLILPVSVIERITMTVSADGQLDNSNAGRIEVWDQSMGYFKENPLLGVGTQVIAFSGWTLRSAHNMYVEIMAEQGIVGLLMFLYLFYQALLNAWNLFCETEDSFFKALGLGVFVSILVTMTTNFFGDHWTYIELGAFYWTFTALAARANIMTEEEKEEEEEGQAEAAGEA